MHVLTDPELTRWIDGLCQCSAGGCQRQQQIKTRQHLRNPLASSTQFRGRELLSLGSAALADWSAAPALRPAEAGRTARSLTRPGAGTLFGVYASWILQLRFTRRTARTRCLSCTHN